MRREVLALEPNAVFLDSQTMSAQVDMALLPARLAAQTAASVGSGRDRAGGDRSLRRDRLRGGAGARARSASAWRSAPRPAA